MLARAVPAILAGPVAGVLLDRVDRRKVMIGSDLLRAVVALGFIAAVHTPRTWLLLVLSGLLMFASPFFTSGRAAILPRIASPGELHTANALTQTTQWTTLTIGTMAAGISAATLGYTAAFVVNSLSFVFSAWAISRMHPPEGGFRASVAPLTGAQVARPWHEYVEGLRYMRQQPLILAVALLGIGWASGGGAAQILFTLFGEIVFDRGPAGIGILWGCAGHRPHRRRHARALARPAHQLPDVQAAGCRVLSGARRRLRRVQPDGVVRLGAGVHRACRARRSRSARCSTPRSCCATSPTASAAASSPRTSRSSGRR